MSHVYILSSDMQMPEFHGLEDFFIENSYYKRVSYPELDRFIKKEYYYSLGISLNQLALLKFKQYLAKNMTPDSEIELWSLWLGGDTTKHYKTMPKVSNISNVDLKDIEDLIDYYSENNFSPLIRKVNISELTISDIAFIDTQSGSCLIVHNS